MPDLTRPNVSPSAPPRAPRRWLRWLLYGAAGFVALVVVGLVAARAYFSDEYIKERVRAALKEALGRDCEIGSLSAGLFSGRAVLGEVRLLNASDSFGKEPGLSIGRLEAQVSLWPLLTSGFTDIRAAKIEIGEAQLRIERRRAAGNIYVTNWDDVIAKLSAGPPGVWPKATGLRALDFDLALHNCSAWLRDPDLGESRIEALELTARQAALGQVVETALSFACATPSGGTPGKADAQAKFVWVDEQGQFGPRTVRNVSFSAALHDLDVGYLARYAGVQGSLAEGQYAWSLGRPVTGSLKAEAPDLTRVSFSAALDTDGVIALWKDGRFAAGNVPGHVEFQARGGWHDGQWNWGPGQAKLALASRRAELAQADAPRLLSLQFGAQGAAAPEQPFRLDFQARLDELLATDVGELLKLKGWVGGKISGEAAAKPEAGGAWKADGRLQTDGMYVTVAGVRQPSALNLEFSSRITPNAAGQPVSAELSFTAKARPFEIASQEPVRLGSLDDTAKLSAAARLRVQVRGRELWQEFGPLLAVFNMGAPLEEALDGELSIAGAAGKLVLQLDGTLQRQTGEASPVRLNVMGRADLAAEKRAQGEPYLSFETQIRAAGAPALELFIKGAASRKDAEETWEVAEFRGSGDLQALSLLNARLGKYVRFFLGPEYVVCGAFQQSGQSRLVRTMKPDGSVGAQQLTFATDLSLRMLDLRGPALAAGKPPLSWQEPEASLHLELAQRFGEGPQTVAIPQVEFKTASASLKGRMAEADVSRLAAAAAGQADAFAKWLEAMPDTQLDASVSASVIERLQRLGVLRDEPLLAGELRLRAEYNAQARQLRQVQVSLRRPDAAVEVVSPALDLGPLAQRAAAAPRTYAEWVPAIPGFALKVTAQAPLLERLQALKVLLADAALRGALQFVGSYDAAARRLKVDGLTFASSAADIALTSPGLALEPLVALLDVPAGQTKVSALPALAGALFDLSLDVAAREPLFDFLRARGWLPQDLPAAGRLAFKARYERAADRLFVEKLDFARAEKCALPLVSLALAAPVEVAKFGKLLEGLAAPANWSALLAHLDRGLSVQQIVVSPAELPAWLPKLGVSGTWLDQLRGGAFRFPAPWSVEGLALRPAGKEGEFDVSAALRTDLAWMGRAEAGKPAPAEPLAALSGAWKAAPVRLRFDAKSAQGTLVLDEAQIACAAAAPSFTYVKPAGTPCRVAFNLAWRDDGALTVAALELAGGPLGFALSNLAYSAAGAVTLDTLAIREGPLVGNLSGVLFDPRQDRLKFAFDGGTLDLAKLAAYAQVPKTLTASGALADAVLSYDGRLSVFPTALTGADKLSFHGTLKDVRLSGRSKGETVDLALNGAVTVTPYQLSSTGLAARLDYVRPGQPALAEQLELVPNVTARADNTTLVAAFAAPGMPVLVRTPLRLRTPFDVLGTVDAVAALAAAASTPGPTAPSGDLSGIAKLRLELSISAPAVTLADLAFKNLEAPSVVLDGPQLTIPQLTAQGYGGQIAASEAVYDIAAKPLRHSQKIAVSNLDLHGLTSTPGKKPEPDSYQVSGRLSATGQLAGAGFAAAERRSWLGDLRVTVADLIAQKTESKKKGPDLAGFGIGLLGSFVGGSMGRGLMLFSSDFGLFLERLEFEPCEATARIQQGRATVAPGTLVGRGANAGLSLGFAGVVDLATETFDPRFEVWPATLPPKTQTALGLDKLSAANRQTILQEFADRRYRIVLTGPVADPKTNKTELGLEFTRLLDRIDKLSQR